MEDPARRDADEDLAAGVSKPVGDGDGVVAGVEGEQRHLPVRR
jgi:hypothetical protein